MMAANPIYSNYKIGEGTYGYPIIYSWNDTSLTIGKYCSFAEGVTILLGGEHRTDWVSTYPFNAFYASAKDIVGHPRTRGDIYIGNDVWIATGALILSGVNIGNGAVIGAHAVVTKDVPPYAIVGGNPAKIIRYRFSEQNIALLNSLAWWDLPPNDIEALIPLLMSADLESLLQRLGNKFVPSY